MSFRAFSAALWLLSITFFGWLFFIGIFGDLGKVPLIGDTLGRPHVAERVAPLLILALFIWVLLELARKQRQVRRQHLAVAEFRPALSQSDQRGRQPGALDRYHLRATARAKLIADAGEQNPSSLHETLPAAASLDAAALVAGYTALNVYAWTLPVLGFIGTASGMASSINGFKDVLSGGGVQIDTLATQLSQSVIPGLAAAFNTTILALAASLVTYLCTIALRGWDQDALYELDRICIAFLAQVPQSHADPSAGADIFVRISEQLNNLTALPSELQAAANALSAAADTLTYAASSAAAIGPAAEALTSAGTESAAAAGAVNSAASALVAASKELHESASSPYHITITRGAHP